MKESTIIELFVGFVIVAIVGFYVWSIVPHADPSGATAALENAGYKNVEITGTQWTGCGQGDTYRTAFKATGATGGQVKGVVCGGVFKGNTIRTY